MKNLDQSVMMSKELEGKVDITQFYEEEIDKSPDLTISFWTNGLPLTSKLQTLKVSGSSLSVSFLCNSDQASRFITTSEVSSLSIFRPNKEIPVLEIGETESISRNLKLNSDGEYMCELVVRMFNM